MKIRIFYFLFPLIFISVLFVSCRKDSSENRVPYVPVDIQLYLNSLDYIPVGGWTYVTGGNRGIVVYRMTEVDFMAYDRTCPYDPENLAAKVIMEATGTTVIDTICGSRFWLNDGIPFAGPSRSPLLQYNTNYDGTYLYIFN